jgi:hypothetical protein
MAGDDHEPNSPIILLHRKLQGANAELSLSESLDMAMVESARQPESPKATLRRSALPVFAATRPPCNPPAMRLCFDSASSPATGLPQAASPLAKHITTMDNADLDSMICAVAAVIQAYVAESHRKGTDVQVCCPLSDASVL